MRNSFERFGIDHLSPSSLNLWRGAPGIFAMRYIAEMKDGRSPAAQRGTSTEVGMAALLRGMSYDDALSLAHTNFDLNMQGIEETESERDLIAPMLKQCAQWDAPSDLAATQIRVEYWFDPIPIPVIGFVDLAFDGIDIDLKTTKACPSAPRADHVRQVSLYRAARGRAGGLLYVTDKRRAYYEIDDAAMDEALTELQADALSLNNFLARCDTREDALRSLPIDWTHFQAPKVKVPLAEILNAG